mmetsp:Transcript_22031/g.50289  ORF Transcript_22031/g.50289 Transcript_22031/m.50289 type:complete len:98 (+) Transcript_22031:767-1060(+)
MLDLEDGNEDNVSNGIPLGLSDILVNGAIKDLLDVAEGGMKESIIDCFTEFFLSTRGGMEAEGTTVQKTLQKKNFFILHFSETLRLHFVLLIPLQSS